MLAQAASVASRYAFGADGVGAARPGACGEADRRLALRARRSALNGIRPSACCTPALHRRRAPAKAARVVLSSRRPIAPFRWKKRPHKSKCSYACLPIRWHGSPCGPAVREVVCTSSAWRASRPRPDSPLPLVSSISASRSPLPAAHARREKPVAPSIRCRELHAGVRIPHLLLPLRRFEFLSFPAARRNAPKEKKRSKRKGPL